MSLILLIFEIFSNQDQLIKSQTTKLPLQLITAFCPHPFFFIRLFRIKASSLIDIYCLSMYLWFKSAFTVNQCVPYTIEPVPHMNMTKWIFSRSSFLNVFPIIISSRRMKNTNPDKWTAIQKVLRLKANFWAFSHFLSRVTANFILTRKYLSVPFFLFL